MKSIKRIGFKIIACLCILLTFCSFVASTPVEASKVINDFNYSGTKEGSYVLSGSLIERIASVIPSFDIILDYFLGLVTMAFRMVFVGWVALLERCLTWILLWSAGEGDKVHIDNVDASSLTTTDEWVTLESIFFNRVPLFDINFFRLEMDKEHTATGREKTEEEIEESENIVEDDDTVVMIIKRAVAGWYYALRAISLMVMLIILIYIGIKMAITTVATEKSLYKRVLYDWIVGMILVFSIHYIMLFMIQFNELLVSSINDLIKPIEEDFKVYEYGLRERAKKIENEEVELDLYDEVKTRAYDAKLTVGTTGMIMYAVLVYYAWKFSFIYLKRYLNIIVLTLMAPVISSTYAYNKVRSGKSAIYSKWFKEYLFTVMLQSIHALLYVIFLVTVLRFTLNSLAAVILVFALMSMISKSEQLFRKIFGMTGSLTDDVANGGFSDLMKKAKMVVLAKGFASKLAKGYTKLAAKTVTTPIRAGSNLFGQFFTGIMGYRARSFDEKEQRRQEELASENQRREEEGKAPLPDYSYYNTRDGKIRLAALGESIKNGEIDLSSIEKVVHDLKEGQSIVDENGDEIGVVDDKYILEQKRALAELELAKEVTTTGKEGINKGKVINYSDMVTKRALAMQFIGRKWDEIMDPYQYVAKGEDGKYRAIKKQREKEDEYQTALFSGKVVDSAGLRFFRHFKPSKLFNLSNEAKAEIKSQLELAEKGITGFLGLVVGVPMLIDNPTYGMMFLSYVQPFSKFGDITSNHGKRKIKTFKRPVNADKKTTYILKGFEGRSVKTITENVMEDAREQMVTLGLGKKYKNREVVQNVKIRHSRLARTLAGVAVGAGIASATGAGLVAVKTLGVASVFKASVGTLTATKMYARTGNVYSNLYVHFQEIERDARRQNWKAYERHQKDGYEHSVRDRVANQYMNFYVQSVNEEIKNKEEVLTKNEQIFASMYTTYLQEEQERIDELSDEELIVENRFEEPIEVVDNGANKKQLSGDAEREVIDNALIRMAQKRRIVDISELPELTLTDFTELSEIIHRDLKKRGVINKGEKVSDVIENFERKAKDRKAKLSQQGRKPVQDKLIDDAIIEVMQKGDRKGKPITNPSKVDSAIIAEVYQRKLDSITLEKPTQNSASVVSVMGEASINHQNTSGSTNTSTGSVNEMLRSASMGETSINHQNTSGSTNTSTGSVNEMLRSASMGETSINHQNTSGSTNTSTGSINEMLQSASNSRAVVGNLTAKPLTAERIRENREIMQIMIADRKKVLASKLKQNITPEASEAMRLQLKRKKEIELDTLILEHEQFLNHSVKKSTVNFNVGNNVESTIFEPNRAVFTAENFRESVFSTLNVDGTKQVSGNDVFMNELGGLNSANDGSSQVNVNPDNFSQVHLNGDGSQEVDPLKDGARRIVDAIDSARKTDSVIQMLDIQTKIHKQRETISAFDNSEELQRKRYVAEIFESRRTDKRKGSPNSGGAVKQEVNTGRNIDDLLLEIKKTSMQ